jgi:hypothetical protein
MTLPTPTILGLKKSFGFGDRLGLATPGHLAAARKSDFAPIFAQQSIREMDRTQRTPQEVMLAAQKALIEAGYTQEWGADADHLKTEADVQITAATGFCFFTIDPSALVINDADTMPPAQLLEQAGHLVRDGIFSDADWKNRYLRQTFEVSERMTLKFEEEKLYRAAVKYARAIAQCEKMAKSIAVESKNAPYEIEVSVDESDSPTSTLEHLFFGLELKRRGVRVVSLAPRFVGAFEKGIDYHDDLKAFADCLEKHVEVAKYCGPYKLSIHSGSDKFSVYPIIGRLCGNLVHVKTAGTSYLEALRVVCRRDPVLFSEIIQFSVQRFNNDRKSYHISTSEFEVIDLARRPAADSEQVYLEERVGRQLLHVTFGSVLTLGKTQKGRPFKEAILELLDREKVLYAEVLEIHFTKHLTLLNAG